MLLVKFILCISIIKSSTVQCSTRLIVHVPKDIYLSTERKMKIYMSIIWISYYFCTITSSFMLAVSSLIGNRSFFVSTLSGYNEGKAIFCGFLIVWFLLPSSDEKDGLKNRMRISKKRKWTHKIQRNQRCTSSLSVKFHCIAPLISLLKTFQYISLLLQFEWFCGLK